MDIQAKALSLLPKNILLGIVKKAFQSKVNFIVTDAEIKIDYRYNRFTLVIENKGLNSRVEKSDTVTEFSDISEVLLSKVKNCIDASKVDVIFLNINFLTSKTETEVYYIDKKNLPECMYITNLF